jgi:ABC-type multidrug transport system fused ATPase/permease subunit
MASEAADLGGQSWWAARFRLDPTGLPQSLLRYILATTWFHQLPLVGLTVAIFLLEVVPLELQRRILNDVVKNRRFSSIVLLCGAYAATVVVQGGTKLGLNVYRSWVGENAKRDLRRRVYASLSSINRSRSSNTQGTVVSMIVAEVEPVGAFIGTSVSEPLLQAGILVTVIAYIIHLDVLMGAAALALFVPQLIFVPMMQHAMNRRTGVRVWLLRQVGAGAIATNRSDGDPVNTARIDRVFQVNMRIFRLKFTMNFLMNLCTHAQIIAALLLGGWWALHSQLEVGGILAFISGIGRLNDPWGDLVNYFRDANINTVKYNLVADALQQSELAVPEAAAV